MPDKREGWSDAESREFLEFGRYFVPSPDPVDKPSRLLRQLKWLEAAGPGDVESTG